MEAKSPILKNLQLVSSYLREAETRIQTWKRYHDETAQQRCNWPPPMNDQTYSKREEAIYGVNTDNSNDTSWFHRHIYEDYLIKAAQRRHLGCNFDRSVSRKETRLEKEVRQLREKLEQFI
jgi:hypothetical protein